MAQTVKAKKWPQLDKQGRIVIPASIREELGIEPGVPLSMWVHEGELHMSTLDSALKRIQKLVKSRTQGRSLVDELIAERRAEAERE